MTELAINLHVEPCRLWPLQIVRSRIAVLDNLTYSGLPGRDFFDA